MVTVGPRCVIEVGDMVARRRGHLCREGRYLLVVANNQQVGGCRVCGSGVGVLALHIVRYACRCGAYIGIVGIYYVSYEALAALPGDEIVKLSAEHAMCDNQITYRS